MANFLSKWMGYKDPSKAAMPYLDRIPQEAGKFNQPFYDNAMTPGQTQNQWGQDYQQSPGFNFAMQQALNGSNQAAAAGGMAGSPMHQQQNMQMASDIASQDYNNWQNRNMGIYNTGAGAAESLQGLNAQNLAQQGNLAYAGRQNNNMANASIVRLLGQLGGSSAFSNYGMSGSGGGFNGSGNSGGGMGSGQMMQLLKFLGMGG